jgi:hypothetical protein
MPSGPASTKSGRPDHVTEQHRDMPPLAGYALERLAALQLLARKLALMRRQL